MQGPTRKRDMTAIRDPGRQAAHWDTEERFCENDVSEPGRSSTVFSNVDGLTEASHGAHLTHPASRDLDMGTTSEGQRQGGPLTDRIIDDE